MSVLGIDPGKKGAACLIANKDLPGFYRFDKTEPHELYRWLRLIYSVHRPRIFFEHVHWIKGDYGPQIATMIREAGKIEGMLISSGVDLFDIHYVEPTAWQLEFNLGGMERAERLKRGKEVARKLYPELTIYEPESAAILIATYGYRKINGELTHGRDREKTPRQGEGIRWQPGQHN